MSSVALPQATGATPSRLGGALLLGLPLAGLVARLAGLRLPASDTGADLELYAALFAVALLLFPAFDRLVRLPQLEPLRALPFTGWMVARGSLAMVTGGALGASLTVALLRADLPVTVTLAGAAVIGLAVPTAAMAMLLALLVAVTDSDSGLGRSLDLDARKPSRVLIEQAPGIAIVMGLIAGLLAWLAVRDAETQFLRDGELTSLSRAATLVGCLALAAGPLHLLSALRGWQREAHRVLARCYDFDRMFDDLAIRQQAREEAVEVPPLDQTAPLDDALRRSWLRTPALRLVGAILLGAAAAGFAAARGVPLVAAVALSAMLSVGALPQTDWRFAATRGWLSAHGEPLRALRTLSREAELQRAAGWIPMLLLGAFTQGTLLPIAAAAVVHLAVGLLAAQGDAPKFLPLLRLPLVLLAIVVPASALITPVVALVALRLPFNKLSTGATTR